MALLGAWAQVTSLHSLRPCIHVNAPSVFNVLFPRLHCVVYLLNYSVVLPPLQEEEESLSLEQAATSEPTEPQPTPAQAPRKHYRNREHFATIRTASLVRTHLLNKPSFDLTKGLKYYVLYV